MILFSRAVEVRIPTSDLNAPTKKTKHSVTEQPRHKRQNKKKRFNMSYVCISCGSMTVTKNLSRTAFAMTAAADWKTVKKKLKGHFHIQEKLDFIVIIQSQHGIRTQRESARHTDLLSLLDELVTVI